MGCYSTNFSWQASGYILVLFLSNTELFSIKCQPRRRKNIRRRSTEEVRHQLGKTKLRMRGGKRKNTKRKIMIVRALGKKKKKKKKKKWGGGGAKKKKKKKKKS